MRRRKYPLHVHISTLFLILLLVVGGLLAGISYMMSRDLLETSAEDLTLRISRETSGELQRLIAPAEMAVGLLSYDALTAAGTLGTRMAQLEMIRTVLARAPALSSVYVGYGNGDFFLVRRLKTEQDRTLLNAPPDALYMVQSIERGTSVGDRGTWLYLGDSLQVLRQEDHPDYSSAYDPRSRGWFKDALSGAAMIRTPPYLFFANRKIGITLATRANLGFGVVGADIELETLSEHMARQKVTPGMQIALVNGRGHLIAHENIDQMTRIGGSSPDQTELMLLRDSGLPVLPLLADVIAGMKEPVPIRQRIVGEDGDWRASITPVQIEGSRPLYLVSAIPDRELLSAASRQRMISLLVIVIILIVAVPVTWLVSRTVARSLRQLAVEADDISHFEFSNPFTVRSFVAEVDQLAVTMESMKRAIRRFLDISRAIAAEKDFDRLLPLLLTEMMSAANAEAAVLYLTDEGRLIPSATRGAADSMTAPDLPVLEPGAAGPLVEMALASGMAKAGTLQHADLACLGHPDVFAGPGLSYGVAVPLLNRNDQQVGLMLLRRQTAIEDRQLAFVQAMSGLYANVLETRELIRSQKALFESFIQLIAGAIDAKSPYTGAHCARVPELTKMLAQAACAETRGPYADFNLDGEQWEAVHVAAWLHDCGKVTTPEYIVDKATKLETIHDRIHEVRMRFEVLKRDAEIACMKAIAAGEAEAAARQRLSTELQALDDDFAFIAECNIGGEFMAPERVERLKRIAQRTWLRTLDDRIGVSHEELARMERTLAMPLPAVETLLADKPEHRFERSPQDRLPENNRWGFRIQVPELLYNRGEIHNLAVARGTLSEEERYKINEHMVQTIKMLSGLHFPKHLRDVPEIAGGHHEKMDGTGYPKRLKREDMSPVARMMVIADIFEALTAADRPYKKAKPLSEAIRIMSFMKKDRHIDPDLFDLFLRSGVWMDYAKRYLGPGQIDEVDVAQYLATPAV